MNGKCFGRARARREAEDLLLGGVLRVVVTVPFFVVVMPLGLALLALAVRDDAEIRALPDP